MRSDVPQWLPQAYVRAIQGAGSPLGKDELREACQGLIERWASADRSYHTVSHLIDTVSNVDALASEMHAPDLVRLAAWYHGIVFSTDAMATYRRNGGENEGASADFAREHLLSLGVSEKNAERVAELIRGIRGTCAPGTHDTSNNEIIDIDMQALRDAHLGTVAVDPQRYKKYMALVRAEYEHIPTADFLDARIAILEHMLRRSTLFLTPLAGQWEKPARENFTSEIQRLKSKRAEEKREDSKLEENKREALAAMSAADSPEASGSALAASFSEQPGTAGYTKTPEATDSSKTDGSKLPGTFDEPGATNTSVSRDHDITEPKVPHRAHARHVKEEQTSSSLEHCDERFEPGEKIPANLSPEQLKQLRREQLANETRKRIEERQTGVIPAVSHAPTTAHSSKAASPAHREPESLSEGLSEETLARASEGSPVSHSDSSSASASEGLSVNPIRPASGKRPSSSYSSIMGEPTAETPDDEPITSSTPLTGMEREPEV